MRLRTLLATLVAGALAFGLAGTAQADPVLAPAKAGTVVAWGNSDDPMSGPALAVPGDLTAPVVSVAANNQATAVVTADGHLRVWGASDAAEVADAPTDVTDAVSVSLTLGSGAVLHADGKVSAWGASPALLDVPADLRAKAISLSTATGYAVRTDGTLARWGDVNPDDGIPPLPDGDLNGLVDVSAGLFQVLALRADGTVVGWSIPAFAAPFTVPDLGGKKVTQIATGITSDGVVLEDGTINVWGLSTPEGAPDLTGKKVISLDLYTNAGAVTDDGVVHTWGSVAEVNAVPASLAGKPVASVTMGDKHAVAVVTSFRDLSKPTVTGTPRVGQVLTATPATFSLTPDAPATGQWYLDAAPITGQTGATLMLDQTMVGKTVSYRSSATRGGTTVTSASNAIGPVTLTPSTTTLTVAPARGGYGTARTATATVARTGGTPTGTVTFKLGSTETTAALTGGRATWVLPKTLPVGTTTLTASYHGDPTTAASTSAAAGVTVSKATSTVGAKVKATGKSRKAVKKVTITVTVRTTTGVSPSGKVTITLKGKTTRKVTAKVNAHGKATVTIKKVERGRYRVQLAYAGNTTVASSKRITTFKA